MNSCKPNSKMEDEATANKRCFKILMYPWLAMGHLTPYLHLSNKLAERGHEIVFLVPNKAQVLLQDLNLHPCLISFHTLTIPQVEGLPPGTETASDIPISLTPFLATALDLTRPQVEHIILDLKPDFVFYDFAYWIPEITSKLGIKSVSYAMVSAATLSMNMIPDRARYFRRDLEMSPTAEELATPPNGYPSSTVRLSNHEVVALVLFSKEYGSGVTFYERITTSLNSADVVALRSCREIEGKFCDYLSSQLSTPVLLTGHVLPELNSSSTTALDNQLATWLGANDPGSVVFCSFGSQVILAKNQFQEILLGFELTGYPFFVALKPPIGCSTIEEALPEGFGERLQGRGIVHGGWVQQPLLLNHPSVGCFVSHCGFGSMWESLMSRPQIVLTPQLVNDHLLNTRNLTRELKVAVEVDKDESGWISKESLCKAIKEAMDKDSEVGSLIKENHAKYRDLLGSPGFMNGYIDSFIHQLHRLLD